MFYYVSIVTNKRKEIILVYRKITGRTSILILLTIHHFSDLWETMEVEIINFERIFFAHS